MTELDRHHLAETYDWQLRRYHEAVKRTISVLVDAIQVGSKYALEREISYGDDARTDYTFIDQAAEIQHAIIQAVNNADFRGLTNTAGDVHATSLAMRLLDAFKAQLPGEMREMLEAREDEGLLGRIEDKRAKRLELETRNAEGCRAAVHQGGRGVGFYRCTKKGKHVREIDSRPGYLGKRPTSDTPANAREEMRFCGTHVKEFDNTGRIHFWTPNDWESSQALAYRRADDRELARMEARLPRQLQAAPQPEDDDA